jgi:hypothetical protein
MLKRREDVQESRRRLFLQNVRQRGEEKRWEMRGGEDEVRFPSSSSLSLSPSLSLSFARLRLL